MPAIPTECTSVSCLPCLAEYAVTSPTTNGATGTRNPFRTQKTESPGLRSSCFPPTGSHRNPRIGHRISVRRRCRLSAAPPVPHLHGAGRHPHCRNCRKSTRRHQSAGSQRSVVLHTGSPHSQVLQPAGHGVHASGCIEKRIAHIWAYRATFALHRAVLPHPAGALSQSAVTGATVGVRVLVPGYRACCPLPVDRKRLRAAVPSGVANTAATSPTPPAQPDQNRSHAAGGARNRDPRPMPVSCCCTHSRSFAQRGNRAAGDSGYMPYHRRSAYHHPASMSPLPCGSGRMPECRDRQG